MSTRKFDIRTDLRTHLATFGSLPDVNWENRYFDIPKDINGDPKPYLRETLNANDENLTANNEKTAIGIYALDYFIPRGYSISSAENLADNIKELFKPAQVIGQVILTKSTVTMGVPEPESPWYMIPIRIYYRAHQLNT